MIYIYSRTITHISRNIWLPTETLLNSLRPSDAYMRQQSNNHWFKNGLSSGRHQAIIWTNAGILLIWPLGTNFNDILIQIHTFSFKNMRLKMSSAKWRPFCLGLNVLTRKALIRYQVLWSDDQQYFALPGVTSVSKMVLKYDNKTFIHILFLDSSTKMHFKKWWWNNICLNSFK